MRIRRRVCIAADDDYRSHLRGGREPRRKCFDLRQSAKSSRGHMLDPHFRALKENTIVPLARSHLLRQRQEIRWTRKVYLGERQISQRSTLNKILGTSP
jgi:hypothetical protein